MRSGSLEIKSEKEMLYKRQMKGKQFALTVKRSTEDTLLPS